MRKFIFVILSALMLASCAKDHEISTYENDADRFVRENPERSTMSENEIDLFMQYCQIWPKETLVDMLCHAPSSTPADRYKKLMSAVSPSRLNNEPRVESIIQYSSRKRIIDANASLVAMTIANLGTSTGGQMLAIDYFRSSANTINNTDVFLAGWAYGTSFQNGSQFAAFDNFIEFQDTEPTYTMELSGGNYFIEAALIYNGSPTLFSFYNTQTGQVEQRTIETGEILVYGPDSEFGELFFNLTLADETIDSAFYNTASIQGPIPGTVSGAAPVISLTGGPWPQIN